MPSQSVESLCPRCCKSFKHKSSLVRHTYRCVQNLKAPSRQKSCRLCTLAKARCDLQRPCCGRCQNREEQCEFEPVSGVQVPIALDSEESSLSKYRQMHDGDEASMYSPRNSSIRSVSMSMPEGASTATSFIPDLVSGENGYYTPPGDWNDVPDDVALEIVMSKQRSQILLGTPHGTLSNDSIARHVMRHVIRVLRSWPRLIAGQELGSSQLPPMIHHLQITDGLPLPLVPCYNLTNMWINSEEGSREVVDNLIVEEVRKLLREYRSYSGLDLLAATQSLLILMILLFFGRVEHPIVSHPTDAELLVEMWDVKHRLASTGLFLDEESKQIVPCWTNWAIVSAKRRTILALHHLEWAWSLLHGYPGLACFELGPLPAPAAGYLWREQSEKEWEHLYHQWLSRWKGDGYKLGELFRIKPGVEMDERSEMWLTEVDEFGMMVMSEVNAINNVN